MLAAFHGLISTDDAYEKIRNRYGATTDPAAQVQALNSLGLSAVFHSDWAAGNLIRELQLGRPVAVGWLHRGTPKAPTDFGHWSVVVGVAPLGFLMNDPNGEADLVRGGYVSTGAARSSFYSARNWLPRWDLGCPVQAHGSYSGRGWAITASREVKE
jgi:hypothetical protein